MALWDLFGKRRERQADKPAAQELWLQQLSLDYSDWKQLFSACLGKMMAIQTACSELVVRGQDWNVDFSQGSISFGKQRYPLQFLGSEAKSSGTWLWGWENINGFPEELLKLAQRSKELGERWQLEPLTTAEFALDETFNGHNLSIVACGLAENYCYYRGPHAGGAIFVAFSGVPKEVFAPVDLQRFLSITTQCIQQFPVDHRLFAEGFLLWNRTPYRWQGQELVANFSQELHLQFEQVGDLWRISSIKSK